MAGGERRGIGILPPPSPVYILRGSQSAVTALEFTNHVDQSLVSGGQNGRVHVWDLTTRRSGHSFDAHDGHSVLCVKSVAPDTLVTHGRDGCFKVWKCTGPDYVLDGRLPADGDGFCPAVLLPQQNASPLAALPSQSSSIQLVDLKSRSPIRTLTPPSSNELGLCMCMCAVPDPTGLATKLVAGYESGKMILWDVGSGKIQHERSVHEDAVMCLSCSSATLNRGLAGSVSERLVMWTLSDAGKIEIIREVDCTNPGFNDVAIRPDDRIAVTAGWDKLVRVFNVKSLRPLAVLAYHRESVRCVRFSGDHHLAVGSNDHLISLWDVYRKA
ncbi:hypothetical protein ACOMHN_040038 [Nucella lapillus]